MSIIRSMTGYASLRRSLPQGILTLDLKSVNNRYFEIYCKLPDEFRYFEAEFRNSLREVTSRGKFEFFLSFEPNEEQKEQAQFLVDNGADIIIGAHPSVVQKMEILQNKEGKDCLVAYSLGDFTSDFSYENSNLELILNIQIYYDAENNTTSLYKVDYVPIYMNDYGVKNKVDRYKLLDMKREIANYGKEESSLDKSTYDKLIRGIDRLNDILD